MASTPDPTRRTAVVTGATSGIGAATARRLAQHGFDVIVAGRTRASAEAAADAVRRAATGPGAGTVDAVWGDLSRQTEVRQVAEQIRTRGDRIDVLINNAGANFSRRALTEDGVEQTLAVDALAPILLTTLLLPALHAAGGRVINVASGVLKTPAADGWGGPQPYSQMTAYAQAKAMLVVLTEQMARTHPGITMISMTPGIVRTGLGRDTAGALRLFLTLVKLVSKQPDDAARGLLDLATRPAGDLTSGAFYKRGRVDQPSAVAVADPEAIWRSALSRFATNTRP